MRNLVFICLLVAAVSAVPKSHSAQKEVIKPKIISNDVLAREVLKAGKKGIKDIYFYMLLFNKDSLYIWGHGGAVPQPSTIRAGVRPLPDYSLHETNQAILTPV